MKIRTLSRLTHDYQVCEVEIMHENGDPDKITELQDKCTAQASVGLQKILGQMKALKEKYPMEKKNNKKAAAEIPITHEAEEKLEI